MISDLIYRRKGIVIMGDKTDRNIILDKLIKYFPGKIVRKDLTKKIKEGANVPVYVLEYLLECIVLL